MPGALAKAGGDLSSTLALTRTNKVTLAGGSPSRRLRLPPLQPKEGAEVPRLAEVGRRTPPPRLPPSLAWALGWALGGERLAPAPARHGWRRSAEGQRGPSHSSVLQGSWVHYYTYAHAARKPWH